MGSLLQQLADDSTVTVAHLIQTALTPVFLLQGIGSLLILFNSRLSRVSDHLQHAMALLGEATSAPEQVGLRCHMRGYTRRIWLLDAAIALGGIGGASACGSALCIFAESVRNSSVVGWSIGFFASALACTVGSLVVFLGDSVLSWHGLRQVGPLACPIQGARN